MKRRRFVLAGAGAGAAALGGCLDTGDLPEGSGSDGSCEPPELVDEPPHDPERPPHPDPGDEDEWDEHYLGDGMDDDSDIAFDRVNLRFREPIVAPSEYEGETVFYADLFTSQEAFDEAVEPVGDDSEARVAEIDFDEETVIVVLSGFGSSSVVHEWLRVDERCDELYLHGYYVQPYIQTDDYTTRVSGVVLDEPGVERAWARLTVDEGTRVNVPADGEAHVVNGDDSTDEDDEEERPGPIEDVEVVQVTPEFSGGWRSDETDDTGVVVRVTDEEAVHALTDVHEDVDRFLEGTDFDADEVFFLESAGPDACHRTIDVGEVVAVADDDGYFVTANAAVVDESDTACAEVITYPAALVRIQSDVDLRTGEFRITDGWGNRSTIEAVTMSEFAQE